MQNEITTPAAAPFEPPAQLSDEQAAQVAGGLLVVAGRSGYCCLTCASFGRQLFSAAAATFTD